MNKAKTNIAEKCSAAASSRDEKNSQPEKFIYVGPTLRLPSLHAVCLSVRAEWLKWPTGYEWLADYEINIRDLGEEQKNIHARHAAAVKRLKKMK